MQFVLYSLLCAPATAVIPPATCDIQQVTQCVESIQPKIDSFNDEYSICTTVLQESASCFAACNQKMMSDFIKQYDNGRCANFNPYAAMHNRLNNRAAKKDRSTASNSISTIASTSAAARLTSASASVSTTTKTIPRTVTSSVSFAKSPKVTSSDPFDNEDFFFPKGTTAPIFEQPTTPPANIDFEQPAGNKKAKNQKASIPTASEIENMDVQYVPSSVDEIDYDAVSGASTTSTQAPEVDFTMKPTSDPAAAFNAALRPTSIPSITGLSPAIHAVNPTTPAAPSANDPLVSEISSITEDVKKEAIKETSIESASSLLTLSPEVLQAQKLSTLQATPTNTPAPSDAVTSIDDFNFEISAEPLSTTSYETTTTQLSSETSGSIYLETTLAPQLKNVNQTLNATSSSAGTTSSASSESFQATSEAGCKKPSTYILLAVLGLGILLG